MDKVLHKAFYDTSSPACYAGILPLYKEAKKQYPKLTIQNTKDWLSRQNAYTLHKPVIRKFPHRRTITSGIGHQFQIDVADMSNLKQYNNGYRYLLTCIDIFSKRAWAIPVKNKEARSMAEAFKKVLAEQKPLKVQSDEGGEFLGRPFQQLLQSEGIKFFTSGNPLIKCAVVERFNRTLKTRIWKFLTSTGKFRYIDELPNIVNAYNNSYHQSLKCRPIDVKPENELKVWKALYGEEQRFLDRQFKFSIGDHVRLAMKKTAFTRGFQQQWTAEVFVVCERKMKDNVAIYRVKDLCNEPIYGIFYQQELQKVYKRKLLLL